MFRTFIQVNNVLSQEYYSVYVFPLHLFRSMVGNCNNSKPNALIKFSDVGKKINEIYQY